MVRAFTYRCLRYSNTRRAHDATHLYPAVRADVPELSHADIGYFGGCHGGAVRCASFGSGGPAARSQTTSKADFSLASRVRPTRLIEYPPRRCGWFVPSRHPDVWLTIRLPAVRGLASERGASVGVSPWCGSKEARVPNPEIRHAHLGP